MGKPSIYYFSGTGNTLYLAKETARLLDAELLPIVTALAGEGRIVPDADVVGIVYPVYYNDLPAVVMDFAKRLAGIETAYVFAVCNYGGCGSHSVKTLGELIKDAGGELSAAYGIHMPQNAFKKPWEKNERIVGRGGAKIRKIAADVKAKKKGNHLKGLLNYIFLRVHPRMLPKIKADLAEAAGLSPELDLDVLIRAGDRRFRATERCTGCGTCARVCPVGNIELKDGKPVWLGRCENCLACYDWCPQRAVEGGVASEGYYYTNPRIKTKDMLAQRPHRSEASET
jgi:ferredoxin/flavodoxin